MAVSNEDLKNILDEIKKCVVPTDEDQELQKYAQEGKWGKLINALSKQGNSDNPQSENDIGTALRLAIECKKPKIIKFLKDADISQINEVGKTALHMAAEKENDDMMKELLSHFKEKLIKKNINSKNSDGETCMHVIAKSGHADMVSVLIDHGIDLKVQDKTGNTFLHDLAEKAGSDQENADKYNRVFQKVVEYFTRKNRSQASEKESKDTKPNIMKMLSVPNNDNLTPMQLAAEVGAGSLAKSMLDGILKVNKEKNRGGKSDESEKNKPQEAKRKEMLSNKSNESSETTQNLLANLKTFDCDITDLTPDTLTPDSSDVSNPCASTGKDQPNNNDQQEDDKVVVADPPKDDKHKDGQSNKPPKRSFLKVVVTASKLRKKDGEEILNHAILKPFTDRYVSYFYITTMVLLATHLTHMIALSIFAIPEAHKMGNFKILKNVSMLFNNNIAQHQKYKTFGLFLVWPAFIIMNSAWYIIFLINQLIIYVNCHRFDKIPDLCKSSFDRSVSLFIFAILAVVWFFYYITDKNHGVILAYVLLVGWLTAIPFTSITSTMYTFTLMLFRILVSDVWRFLCIYFFIAIAFGCTFVCLAGLSPLVYSEFDGSVDIYYQTVGMLFGAGDVMVDEIDKKYKPSGQNPWHYKMIYLLYALATIVILLNILIAMMTDSYRASTTETSRAKSPIVSAVGDAIAFEEKMIFLRWLFKKIRQHEIGFKEKGNEWFITVEKNKFQSKVKKVKESEKKVEK